MANTPVTEQGDIFSEVLGKIENEHSDNLLRDEMSKKPTETDYLLQAFNAIMKAYMTRIDRPVGDISDVSISKFFITGA